ncbi:HNH endonuclease [Salmonella enterica]|nr:HNH endonuclease [Salmonella enterica]ECJ3243661.1 HNH endonuclease [Salmonella enterica]
MTIDKQAQSSRLSPGYLKECLDYDSQSGLFFWKKRPFSHFASVRHLNRWNSLFVGKKAGSPNSKGYMQITLDRVTYKAHRLAWMYCYGKYPELSIDHINGVHADNRIANLRLATKSENGMNRGPQINNTSGVKGVCWKEDEMLWVSQIGKDGKTIYLGRFDNLFDAVAARRSAEITFHGEYRSINFKSLGIAA